MGESFIFLSDFLPEMDPSSGVTIFLPSLPLIAVLGGGRGGPPPKCFCPLCSKRLLAGEVNIFAQSLEGKRKGEEDKLVPSLSRLSERKSHFAALIPDWHHLDAPPFSHMMIMAATTHSPRIPGMTIREKEQKEVYFSFSLLMNSFGGGV